MNLLILSLLVLSFLLLHMGQKHAIAAYNFLIDEGRRVAGLFFPTNQAQILKTQRRVPTRTMPSEADSLREAKSSVRKAEFGNFGKLGGQ